MPLPLMDVATLVLADRDCDGLFSLPDLLAFATDIYKSYCKYSSRAVHGMSGEIEKVQSLVRGELANSLWLLASRASTGILDVTERITTILIRNRPICTFVNQPGIDFVDSNTVHTCFRMCAVRELNLCCLSRLDHWSTNGGLTRVLCSLRFSQHFIIYFLN